MKKVLAVALSLSLVLAIGIAGTLAWLTDKTDTITNTFTIGNVDIGLTETTGTAGDNGIRTHKVSPGIDVAKNPTVTVKADSEASYVFVKLEETGNFDAYFTYTIASGWTELTTAPDVYYRTQAATTADAVYSVLAGDKVTVGNTVSGFGTDAPTLKVTAYAIQQAGIGNTTNTEAQNAAAAWTALTTP